MDYGDAHQADRRPVAGSSLARGEIARLDADQLGPYTLIAEISSGDFTTVHLAHKRGAHGFDRLVAIKRLKPAYARQPEWSQLLLDEARLGASVDHPNTVDILDVGTDAGVYVVMDYVEGADLEQLLARAGRERHPRFVLPPLIDALTGLHAIHTQKDELGEPLAMVHQAPRARHILVGIHGAARVTDFSQVTARGLIPSTLRGKGLSPAYMAPEQVLISEPVSARTDVFILGITLWEALTGERLFVGETPSLVRRAITERDIPKPSEMGLLPPRCFDGIVMRALQRNPELRYQSAAEMARDLREVAQEEALLATASEVGQWVRALASRSLLERRRALGADDRSEEIAIDVLEKQLAADRARNLQFGGDRESIPFARDSIAELVVEKQAANPVTEDPALQVAPAITVPVQNHDASKREPTQQLKTPGVTPKRSATGTLIGVTAKPRSVGLPPPAAAALQAKMGSVPPYRGSLGRTALEAPRIEIKPAGAALSAKNTLPEGGAFISELELPIDLPTAKPERTPSFVGFSGVIDVEAEPVTPSFGRASFGGAAAQSGNLRETNAYGAQPGVLTTPAPSAPTPFNGGNATMAGVSAPVPAQPAWTAPPAQPAWTTPPSQPSWTTPPPSAAESAAPAWTPPPAAAPSWGAAPESSWRTPPAAHAPAGLGSTREEKRRSEPPARQSRPSMHTLDGNVPNDVFERLRAAPGVESWRPPANAVRQPWHDEEEVEPRGYGRTFAIAATIAVAGFFGYRQLATETRPALPPRAASVNQYDPQEASRATRAALEGRKDVAPAPAAPEPQVAPQVAPQANEPAAVVPPVSFGGWQEPTPAAEPPARAVEARGLPAREQSAPPVVKRAAPAPVARPQLRREEPLARPAKPRRGAAYRPETLPDNPY
ncbi:MAG: protein kinase [Polyangiales bacterium]